MSKEMIDFCVAPYALSYTLLVLDNNGVKEIYLTKCDNDLHIRIPKEELRKSVYPIKENILKCAYLNKESE